MTKKNDEINKEMVQSKSYTILPNHSNNNNFEKMNLERIQSIKPPNTTINELIKNNNDILFKSIENIKI